MFAVTVAIFFRNEVLRNMKTPNTACTRLVSTCRNFRQFAWLEVGSVKMAWSRPGRAPGWCPIPPTSTPEGAYPQGATQTQAVGQRNLDTIIHLKCVS